MTEKPTNALYNDRLLCGFDRKTVICMSHSSTITGSETEKGIILWSRPPAATWFHPLVFAITRN